MKWIVLTGFLVLLGHGEGYASVIDAFPEKKAEGEAIAAAVPLSRKVRGAPEDAPKVCQAGEGFRLDCNTCLCDNEGLSFSCTRIDCNAQSAGSPRAKREDDPNFRCNPGEQYTRDCNDCTCSADGRSVFCTQRLCDETLNGLTP